MAKIIKSLFLFVVVGLIGGFFAGQYLLDSYPAELQQEILGELNNAVAQLNIPQLSDLSPEILLGIMNGLTSAGYGLVLGALGIVFAKKVGLWKDEVHKSKRAVFFTIAISIVGGLGLILPDMLYFGQYSEEIMASYASKPTLTYILASITYGAVVEEVMLRLFAMSLIAFIFHKIWGKGKEKPTVAVFILANILSALLFAAGHLPATFLLLGNSPMIIARCFLLNGGFGLLFGWLYRKYGLRYAMFAHGGCHIISKLIWILFI